MSTNNGKVVELNNANIFQKETLILSNVNLKLTRGEFVYLIGKVGTGKTSLIKTINAELPMHEGEGFVAGFDLRNIKKKEVPFLRRKLGIVFQDFQLLSDRPVYNNLAFVLHATGWKNKVEIKQRIEDVLNMVGLQFKGFKMPHELSGGEQQRVVIARALLNDPEIILADEPTGNLDPETSKNIMQILFDIRKQGKTILMATHNYNLLKDFPEKTIKCENGTIPEPNEPSEIDFTTLTKEQY
jgi:cell division transport system ATP-binding protein